ncbi:MAG: RNA pseudouridine synthase [Balneolaceae bacterium]|nr:RNA pseudouridine synthase [Balneolaceae bacterium]
MMNRTGTQPDIKIVYEDKHLLVVDKPHNLLSQEDRTGDPDLVSLCKDYLTRKRDTNGGVYLGLIHRLDRPAGGLMVLAKSPEAARTLSRLFRERSVQKTYYAVVQGNPPVNGVLIHHLHKDREANTVEPVAPDHPEGKRAELSFQRLEESGDLSLVEVHLQTGRPHQIRVQLASEGYPVWGDYRYGPQQPDGRTLALRSVELRFRHPVPEDRREMRFRIFPPAVEPWDRFDSRENGEAGVQ